MSQSPKQKPHPLSADDLRTIVARHLPAWFRACAAEADAIVMHDAAFGTSEGELFLFACAIKYAATVGKTVHVTCESEEQPSGSKLAVPENAIDGVYRDRGSSGRASRRRRKASK